MWKDFVQSTEGLSRTQEEILLPYCLNGDTDTLQAFELKLKNKFYLVLQPIGFKSRIYTIGSPR